MANLKVEAVEAVAVVLPRLDMGLVASEGEFSVQLASERIQIRGLSGFLVNCYFLKEPDHGLILPEWPPAGVVYWEVGHINLKILLPEFLSYLLC